MFCAVLSGSSSPLWGRTMTLASPTKFGALLQVPDWLVKLHPWGRLGMPPRDDFAWLPFGIELGSAVALACLGLLGFIRRDLTNE